MEEKIHNIILEDRCKLSVTACSHVVNFNETEVVLVACDDTLTVKGSDLKVEEVSKARGEVTITGEIIDSITYSKGHRKGKEGMLRRMFK